MRDVLVGFGVDVPIAVVPNGVDLKPFQQVIDPVKRTELGFSADDIVLTFVGRLGPEKNVAFLLQSFGGAVQAFDHARLLIIGDGPERENLELRAKHMDIESYVRFIGPQPYEKIPGYMALSDAFVTASVTEVHPLTVIEAMAAGLPVLGIQSPGIGDTIQDGQTGYLVAEEELAGFTAKMVRMIVDGESRKRMAEQARVAAQDYAIECTVKLMEERYIQVTQQAAGRKRGLRARWMRWFDQFSR
jgi:glycosyltransferase involved in cell wall biosynthesis